MDMRIEIRDLYRSAFERCNETLGTRWVQESHTSSMDPDDVLTVTLNSNVILKTCKDTLKIDLAGKVEYIDWADFVEVVIR